MPLAYINHYHMVTPPHTCLAKMHTEVKWRGKHNGSREMQRILIRIFLWSQYNKF
jgi:hypothetical protein